MQVRVENRSGRLQTIVLDHDGVCSAVGRCTCTEVVGLEPRRIPSALTLAAGESATMDGTALSAPALRSLIARGWLVVTELEEPTPDKRKRGTDER
jgi:hypothetical protein